MIDTTSPSPPPLPPLDGWQKWGAWIIVAACIAGALLAINAMLTGCVAIPRSEADGGPAYAVGVSSGFIAGAAESPWLPFLPGPVKALAPLLLLLFPKVRDNAAAAVSPSTPGEQRLPAAAAAVVPYFNSPPVVREKQARREQKKAEKREARKSA